VLANALHFKSAWSNEFELVEDDSFYVTPSDQVPVQMMTLVEDLQYYHDEDLKFAALQLPYKVNTYCFINVNLIVWKM